MKPLLEYLSLNSTWRGLILIATAFGAALNSEQWQTIVEFGIGTAGFLLVVTKK